MQARSEIRRRTQGTYLRLSLRELPPIYGRFRQNLRRAGRRAGPRRPPVPPGRRPGSAARGGTQARGPQTAPAPGRRPGNRALSSAGTDRFEDPFYVPADRTVLRQLCPCPEGTAANIGGCRAIPYGIPWRWRTAGGNAVPASIPRNCEKQFRGGREIREASWLSRLKGQL